VSFSPEDSQFLQSRQFSVQDVCRWFKVSPHLVGDPSRLAYASSEAEFNAYLVHSLSPHLVNIQSEINCTLLGDDAEYLAEFDFNGMARGSQVERYAAYEKGLGGPNPWLTVADVRAAENLPFLPGTDQIPQKRDPNAIAA
jgi:HK97 family phage portal protein